MVILSRYIATSDYVNMPNIGLTEVISLVDAYLHCVDNYLLSSSPWGTAQVQSAGFDFAEVHQRADKLDQSLELYRQVLDGHEKTLCPNHTSTLETVNNLGNLYSDQGKLVEAKELYWQNLTGKKKALGPNHTSTRETVHNLGLLYSDQGKLVVAEEMYRRELTRTGKALGPDHTSTLSMVHNLGLLHYY
jgi:tetratricopeptide (TPR) repeat protein